MQGSQLSINEEGVNDGRAESTDCRSEGEYRDFVRELEMGAICSDDCKGEEDFADESVSLEFFDMSEDEIDHDSESTYPTEELFVDDETDREVPKTLKRQKKSKGASSYLRRRKSVIRQRIVVMLLFIVFLVGMWVIVDALGSQNRRGDSSKGLNMSSRKGKDSRVHLGFAATNN